MNPDLETRRSAIVCYGSETGNAQDYADELGRQLERVHFTTSVCKLDAVEPIALTGYTLCVVVVSTTGQGELPNNARVFWKYLLQKKLPSSHLEGVIFTTFGLGDSSYPRFNWAARKLHKRLIQVGAVEFHPRGEADEQNEDGLDASFVPWALDLRKDVLAQFPLANGMEPIPDDKLLKPEWLLTAAQHCTSIDEKILSKQNHTPNLGINGISESKDEIEFLHSRKESVIPGRLKVKLEENRRMTSQNHWQDVRHLVFSSNLPAPYVPGDVLTIYPRNSEDDVNQIVQLMNWSAIADREVRFHRTDTRDSATMYSQPPILMFSQSPMTFRDLITHHLDLTAIPRRSFFTLIAHFTQDHFQKERLLEFTKPEYIDELYDYTTRPRRSILEVLQEFESVKIPWQWAATTLPELRGRQFSIASGGVLKQGPEGNARFELLVAIVKYKTVIKKTREGVCTRYLAALQPGSKLAVSIQRGGLGITKTKAKSPVVMIGPGTGLAPMRSLIWERLLWAQEMHSSSNGGFNETSNGDVKIGKSLLVFGCRNQDTDYFYNNEWKDIEQRMPLQVLPAFSRDQGQKIYVQDLINQHSTEVFRLLHDLGGTVYVCGSSGKMPIAVRNALIMAFQRSGSIDHQSCEEYLLQMEKEGRYKQETW